MIEAMTSSILPIFAVMAIGFAMARRHMFAPEQAVSLSKFVLVLGVPCLMFTIVAKAPLDQLNFSVMGSYLLAEVIIYAVVFVLAHKVFGRDPAESILLGMTATFSNHVFFVLPIAELVWGPEKVSAIAGLILTDVIMFIGSVYLADAATSSKGGFRAASANLLKNPLLLAAVVGVCAWFLGDLVPRGVFAFAQFTGAAAAPISLFALGVILAGLNLRPLSAVIGVVILGKLVFHPLLTAGGIAVFGGDPDWAQLGILVAAGPCGAMPFVIATQYGIRSDLIAKAVLISSVLSIFTLAAMI